MYSALQECLSNQKKKKKIMNESTIFFRIHGKGN